MVYQFLSSLVAEILKHKILFVIMYKDATVPMESHYLMATQKYLLAHWYCFHCAIQAENCGYKNCCGLHQNFSWLSLIAIPKTKKNTKISGGLILVAYIVFMLKMMKK